MKNDFYFKLKALLSLRYQIFCHNFFDVGKRLAKKPKVNFKIYDVTEWTTNTVFTQVSARGAHLILSSQRGALIRWRHSFEGGAH